MVDLAVGASGLSLLNAFLFLVSGCQDWVGDSEVWERGKLQNGPQLSVREQM